MREAADGADFVDRVLAETGLSVRVLSGEEEARYAALGVLAGTPDAVGVVGDLGGSSLELIRVAGGRAGARASPCRWAPSTCAAPDGFDPPGRAAGP